MRWGGAEALIFSVPCTDVKILAIMERNGMRGAIYNPYKLADPVTWLSSCPHCRAGKQKKIPVKIRRAIQFLCSIKPDGPDGYKFTLPNRYILKTWQTSWGWEIRVRKPGNGDILHMSKPPGSEPIELRESPRGFRSPMLLRTLRMLFSARKADGKEVEAIMLPLKKKAALSNKPPKLACKIA